MVGILPVVALLVPAVEVSAQQTGGQLYTAACAACHGDGGTGVPASTLGFDTPVPDFSDCSFASREPDGDWLWVVHEGGPVRAFDRMMPAFGDALSEDETLRILRHIRVFCEDPSWPRGELNLPRPLATEKAFPEDEYVLTLSRDGGEAGEITSEFLYEKRFGSRNQIEVLLPFRFGQPSGDWNGGVGDMAFAYKRVLFHSVESGSILSAAGEVVVPTGDRERGLGDGVTVLEPFVAFGQILPRDSFVHFQAGFELPSGRRTPEGNLLAYGARNHLRPKWFRPRLVPHDRDPRGADPRRRRDHPLGRHPSNPAQPEHAATRPAERRRPCPPRRGRRPVLTGVGLICFGTGSTEDSSMGGSSP